MTDDLKERLLTWHPGQDEEALREEALARITDLEARLAAAEAGEDALAEAVRRQIAFEAWWKTIGGVCPEPLVDVPIKLRAALAAYDARRKG